MYAASPLHAQSLFLYCHRGDARGDHGAPLHDQVHLPTYLPKPRRTTSWLIFCGLVLCTAVH